VATPDQGDLVWLDFDPQAGREQSGRRPAVVLSPRSYHQKTSFAIVCPITSQAKGYPFEVRLPPGLAVAGVVLADQIRSIDRHVRRIEPAGRVPREVVQEVIAKIMPLLTVTDLVPRLSRRAQ
jgi:mRNA interferase MazF